MNEFSQQIASLSPEQRLLLERRLKQKGLNTLKTQTILKRKDSQVLPLSFAQQRLWFVQQLDSNNYAYNVPAALHIKGPLNVAVLERAFNEIIQRHETLRTTFQTNPAGEPIQVIASTQPITLPVVDLRGIPEIEQQIQRLATEEARQPFDLTQPLLRLTLLRLAEAEYVLLLTMHHIISDRWSIGVFVREMKELYIAFSAGKPSPLPELPIQYADWAIWQRQYLQGEVLETQLSYWKQQLANLPVLELPTDWPRPAVQTYQGTEQPLALPKALCDALKAFSAKEGVTLFMVTLAAFKILLHKYTGQDEIVVGTDIANRNRVETEGLIGFLINSLVLRTNLGGNPTFRELVSRVREVTLGAYAHQDLPFEKLVEVLNPERSLSRVPLSPVRFDFQQASVPPLELADLSVSSLPVNHGIARFDLRLNLWETEQGLKGHVRYNTGLFKTNRITRIINQFEMVLQAVITQPEKRILEIKERLTQVEQQEEALKRKERKEIYRSQLKKAQRQAISSKQ